MDWHRDLSGWPNHDLSRRVRCRPHDWHVQETGQGRTILLLHGAGASTHSWRDVIPLLAHDSHVVAIDLPGQGFTRMGTRSRCGLEPMTEDIAALCADQGWQPALVIGHSAGGPIAFNLARRLPDPPAVAGINAAMGHFDGVAGWLFPLLARALALTPLTAYAVTLGGASRSRARRIIESTGSRLDDIGIDYYARLLGDAQHVDATLQMMAQWDVTPLLNRLDEVAAPCLLVTGDNDRAVPPENSARVCRQLPGARHLPLPGLGHLAHEEDPERVVTEIRSWWTAATP